MHACRMDTLFFDGGGLITYLRFQILPPLFLLHVLDEVLLWLDVIYNDSSSDKNTLGRPALARLYSATDDVERCKKCE